MLFLLEHLVEAGFISRYLLHYVTDNLPLALAYTSLNVVSAFNILFAKNK